MSSAEGLPAEPVFEVLKTRGLDPTFVDLAHADYVDGAPARQHAALERHAVEDALNDVDTAINTVTGGLNSLLNRLGPPRENLIDCLNADVTEKTDTLYGQWFARRKAILEGLAEVAEAAPHGPDQSPVEYSPGGQAAFRMPSEKELRISPVDYFTGSPHNPFPELSDPTASAVDTQQNPTNNQEGAN